MVKEQYFIENLDRAINEEWIKAYHQPLVRAASGFVSDEEAFARWEDPDKGIFSPADFLPVLESEKLTYKLDLYMAERVLNKMKGQAEHGLYVVPESINLARSDFYHCDMVKEIVKRIDASGLSRDKLSIELSERTISSDVDFFRAIVERFQAEGIHVWMDDYGSGYSSLLILLKIKFNLLKIDKAFVDQIEVSESGRIILTELIKTAVSLGMDTVAEGVETQTQAEFLTEIGCTKLQGYYYIYPISLEDILERNKKGIQIGFENPAETEYYELVGKVNLYDLSISSEDDSSLSQYFNTMPMAIFSFGKDSVSFLRGNQSFKRFIEKTHPQIRTVHKINYSSIKPGPGYYSFSSMKQCAADGKRVIIDDRYSDGRSVQLFIRRIAVNPVTGDSAVSVVVLSVAEKNTDEGLTYNYIARALSSDYIKLYFVDMDTEKYTEYASDGESRDISIETHGHSYFNLERPGFTLEMDPEDKAQMIKDFTKENVINGIEKDGVYSYVTRIILDGKPVYVNLKAVKVRGEGNSIIVGLNNVDNQTKARAAYDLAMEERIIYSRISALSGDYIYLYIVDLATNHYSKYDFSETGITESNMEEGDDFFAGTIANIDRFIYHEDKDAYLTAFSKENILKQIANVGVFEFRHRMNVEGNPVYVIMRAVIVNEDGEDKLLVGIINIDDKVRREQEYEEHIFAAENKASLDELTGVKNKHAYTEAEETLNKKIASKKASSFAVAVFDINGLKQVNDTLGHQAGDKFIQDGCAIICDFFKHSPVFRIGGDEFAVIIQGNDYRSIDKIMASFHENNLKSKASGNVVIAAGYSRFNGDPDVATVFERADEEMYKNKKALKI